jgi:hypothetical protein
LYLGLTLKKPLCIDSRLVYKIDSINHKGIETLYSCNQQKKVPFSNYFYDHVKALEARLIKTEIILAHLGIMNKFVIVIDNINMNLMQELPNGIQIGVHQLKTDQLEKKLIQLGLKNKFNISNPIELETLADFFLANKKHQNLISEAWDKTFNQLGFYEKNKALNRIIQSLDKLSDFSNKASTDRTANYANLNAVPEQTSIASLKSLLLSSQMQSMQKDFTENLQHLGFYSSTELANTTFDFIIESTQFQKINKALIALIALAKTYPNLKIALKNNNNLFLLPSYLKISAHYEKKVRTKYRIIFSEDLINSSFLKTYLKTTESLVITNKTLAIESLKFDSLFSSGMHQFLSQNKHFNFIQIHLPSYTLKYRELRHVDDYFDFVKIKDLSRLEHKALGWNHTEWLEDMNIFKPIAHYDVIQYFRVN